ncbi:GvpL/GvpF family gas vesicle protein [Desulfosporosinus nitroreducens]|uniref:GvpL/GvpF family gas vesicle protein n=1 Tax=Desulfosporosinus nitroreducens TaxID=2018668 RepID=UPI00207C6C41|nr:GvpL/GvpF family gas vesicle protein [Desulfosporosinus nitroreducens]MCO1603059.1 GvpL/GvpF family gas vesicle protein [Desulfosporosinus nitroreducens]
MNYREKSNISQKSGTKEKGYYIYCILQGSTAVIEDHKGIDGIGNLFLKNYRNLTAVVSEVELDTFKAQIAAVGEEIDREWIEEKAQTHEKIVERLMKENALLPARFCSIVRKKEDIIAYMADNYHEYERALERLKGREEWGVKAYLSFEKFKQFIIDNTPEIRERREMLAFMSIKASFLIQRKIDNLIKERMDKRLEGIIPHIVEILRDASEQESIAAVEIINQEQVDNSLFFKASYLVEKNLFPAFNHKLHQLSAELEPEGITLVVSGPWPPYSFVEDKKNSDLERSLVRMLFPIRWTGKN